MDKEGNYIFQGRKDRQIKLRGVRLELEEIEITLRKSKLVKNIVVVPEQNHNTPWHVSLVAYVVCGEEGKGLLPILY